MLRENLDLVSPLRIHYLSIVLANAITVKSNSTDATLSPFLNPTLNSNSVSNYPITKLITLSLYILLIVSHRLGEHPYFASIITIN